ncbi:MAG: pentapeptide repeat-containing protein, partial [Hydrococcus sp. SU_1_0]|nr:pentapeptide repeat-containing protein [Hydrococcus sp. SU_1_0]
MGLNNIEVFTVLNVIILLLELHRFGKKRATLKSKINFHPCEKCEESDELKDSTRLLRIIGLSFCLGIDGFSKTIGSFLSEANLAGANLAGANLAGANLAGAILRQVE